MINDIYDDVKWGIANSLFGDDGAMWTRGQNFKFIVKKLQGYILKVF